MLGALYGLFFAELTSRNVWITFQKKVLREKKRLLRQTGADAAGLS